MTSFPILSPIRRLQQIGEPVLRNVSSDDTVGEFLAGA